MRKTWKWFFYVFFIELLKKNDNGNEITFNIFRNQGHWQAKSSVMIGFQLLHQVLFQSSSSIVVSGRCIPRWKIEN